MKKYAVTAAIAAFVFALSGASWAVDAAREPRAFRNIAWGQSFETLPDREGFVLSAQDAGRKYYIKKQDNMTMDGVKLESVRYIFLSGRFIGARVEALGEAGASRLLLFLQGRYGEEERPLSGGDNCEWNFPNLKLTWNYDRSADKTTVSWITGNIAEKTE